jgi:hypothetical protein
LKRLKRVERLVVSFVALTAALMLLGIDPARADPNTSATTPRNSTDPGETAYADGRFVDALRIWRPRADAGDAAAEFGLGLLYDLGEGVGQDAAAAFSWYHRAAEAGYVLAEFNVAVMLDSGVGAARDPAEAALWYARAAAHGYARAEYNLGQLYQAGDGAPRNLDVAERWYAAAAAHGLSAAARKVAELREEKAPATVAAYAARPTIAPAVLTGSSVSAAPDAQVQVELSWAAPAEPLPVDYFVQVLALDKTGARRAFTSFSKQSSVLVSLPRAQSDYAWRVYTVVQASVPDYIPSAWSYFSTR